MSDVACTSSSRVGCLADRDRMPALATQVSGFGDDRDTYRMGLFDAEHYQPDDMLVHPRHQQMQPVLAALIQQLRDCETTEGGVAFQHDLLTRLLQVEKDYSEFKRAASRLAKGKSPHPKAPEPQSGRDSAELGT